jgi:hypothetical protein
VKKALPWILLGAVVLLGIAGLAKLLVSQIMAPPLPPLAVRGSIAKAEFTDDYRLDILLHGEGSITDGIMSRPTSIGSIFSSGSTGSSTSSFGSTHLQSTAFTINDSIAGLKFSSECLGDLLL